MATDPVDALAASLAQVRGWLAEAQRVAVLTGAGVSAESGVPTFRDAQQGLWAQFDPQQLATEVGFRADPALVWGWYGSRREAIARVQPNAGHSALAAFAQAHPGRLTLITQNVDGLHQRAGSPDVLALHGHIFEDHWLGGPGAACELPHPVGVPCDVTALVPGHPPRCRACGRLVRPGVVWFGESLPEAPLRAAEQAASACDVMLVVGTAGAVYPAAGLVFTAREAGARVVVLNPQPTELDALADVLLRCPSAQGLPALLDGL
ncbi:SIR2 family NAD-dependent protein deacylase [Curvibacter gracilis]|uniref:SIR2 family NAD-dependent protein deacylase n=1 Tax=Curvibacter gracilis TaxID=230310 RepID=UPI0004B640C3|nr:NAD-dependent deacylase [Curvibacter gracilis]